MADETSETPQPNERLVHHFAAELALQSKWAMMGILGMSEQLDEQDPQGVFMYAQMFLTAAGNVSKLMWGPYRKPKDEADRKKIEASRALRKRVRELLDVPDDSILKNRKLRNDYEHFDERMEDWAARDPDMRFFIDTNVMPEEMLAEWAAAAGATIEDGTMRNFDPDRASLIFQGGRYPLKPLHAALLELYNKALPFRARFPEGTNQVSGVGVPQPDQAGESEPDGHEKLESSSADDMLAAFAKAADGERHEHGLTRAAHARGGCRDRR